VVHENRIGDRADAAGHRGNGSNDRHDRIEIDIADHSALVVDVEGSLLRSRSVERTAAASEWPASSMSSPEAPTRCADFRMRRA